MPELPEVETIRRALEAGTRGRRIDAVRCADDPIVFEGVPPAAWRKSLLGARILGAGRRGKHAWLELDRRPWPCFHLGMTGEVTIEGPGAESPRFWKIDLGLDDGRRIVLSDARRLGRLRLRDDPLAEPPVSELGFDPLLDLPRRADFAARLARTSRPLKALLLDQSFSAGVGNWVADEVLFQAALDPRRAADSLSGAEAETLRQALGRVVRHAVRVGADSARFPEDWLFHRRWGKKKDAVTRDGDAIRFLVIGGRTTAWVPSVQAPGTREPRPPRAGPKPAPRKTRRGPRSSRP